LREGRFAGRTISARDMMDEPLSTSRFAPLAKLVVALMVLAVLWLGLLPALTRTKGAARHIRTMQEGGVNPGAMFYSELEGPEPFAIPLDAPPSGWKSGAADSQ